MNRKAQDRSLHPAWWTVILLVAISAVFVVTVLLYEGAFTPTIPVTVTSDRSGLVMETDAKVMLHGVQVGHVSGVSGGRQPVSLRLDIDRDQLPYIPANVGVQIRATTAFGAKFVDLVYPDHPDTQRLRAGAVLASGNVSTEVNTVLESLVGMLHQMDPAKVNAVLAALSEGLGGQGERIGQSITDTNQVLLALNPRGETIRRDFRALQGVSDTYNTAARDIVSVLDAVDTTSRTVTGHAAALDALLLNVIGLSRAGINLLGPNEKNFVDAINTLEPTTNLLLKYNPEYTCLLQGAKWFLDNGGRDALGGNGKSYVADATILLGKDKYNYPENLPLVAAKGGPGGKPGCGSLPDLSKMWPVRQLVTNTGWGTGLDIRPNPGVAAQTCYANFLPVTRAVPEPPSIRDCLPGKAVGPVTAPGMPPYGAHLYGPGGVPLWPGIPPAGIPPPVPVPGTPVAPGKIPANPPPPAVFGERPPLPPIDTPAPAAVPKGTTP